MHRNERVREHPELGEELDGAPARLRDALGHLARLLGDVHVQRQRMASGVRAELGDPLLGHRPDGVRSDADTHIGIIVVFYT